MTIMENMKRNELEDVELRPIWAALSLARFLARKRNRNRRRFRLHLSGGNTAGLTTKRQRLDSSTASAWWMKRSPRRLEWTIAPESRLLETSLINELVPRSRLPSGGSHYPASRRASWGTLSLAGEAVGGEGVGEGGWRAKRQTWHLTSECHFVLFPVTPGEFSSGVLSFILFLPFLFFFTFLPFAVSACARICVFVCFCVCVWV